MFLPLQKTLKQWSDRKKWVEEPIFKSYLFIKTELERNYYEIINIPGIVKFVNFGTKPVLVDIREIELIKLMLSCFDEVNPQVISPEETIDLGEDYLIISGPLMGNIGKND